MLKAIFFDAGGVLFLNKNGRGVVNKAVVDFMTNHDTCTYGLLSSTDIDMEPVLREFDLTPHFSLVQTTGQVGIEKDSPKFFAKAVEVLGIQPSEAVMVDNDQDFINAATQAGLHTILYTEATDLSMEITDKS